MTGCGCKHEWVDATCTAPKTCSKCQETEGEALGHTEGEWELTETDVVNTVEISKKCCTVCGTELDSKETKIDKLHDDTFFLFSPEQFFQRLEKILDLISDNDYRFEISDEFSFFYTQNIFCGEERIAHIDFDAGNEQFSRFIGEISVPYGPEVYTAVIMTCDPSLSLSEASEIVNNILPYNAEVKNGVRYFVSPGNFPPPYDDYFLEIKIPEQN